MKINPKNWLSRKRITWVAIIAAVLIGGYFLFFNKKVVEETLAVHPADFLQQVSASGKIVAKENLDLSFEEPGQVSSVNVRVGQNVYAGQLLASQSTGQLQAQLAGMQAGIQLEQARLDQLLAGNSPEDIQTGKNDISLAQQNLDNAYISSQNILDNAYTALSGAYTQTHYIQQTYFNSGDLEVIKVQAALNTINDNVKEAKQYLDNAKNSQNQTNWDIAIAHIVTDLNSTYAALGIIRQTCEEGLYYTRVTATDKASLDTQKTSINTALSSVVSSQTSIAAYKVKITQAKDALVLKQAPARTSDIAVYKAQIAQAKANAQNVIAQLNKKRIYSPINGVVTAVNAKPGKVFSSQDVAVSVISKNNFEVESYVPEINISLISINQETEITLDSYPTAVFAAKVISIDPAETIKDGVSTYKVTIGFNDNNDPRIKSGMTGTITITTERKSNVISIPQGAVQIKNGQKIVRVKTSAQAKEVTEKAVTTGSVSSSGNIEIISGLDDGDIVVLN
ncbi:efflux RND transporter periplasmic adaptor subunit [Candidatus Parcubacteria bacterium]|nr:efflux RND transporter periplasmic adaptor subunit [Candidatus Parcubacteria bacterium]